MHYPDSPSPLRIPPEEFDLIVVGAGHAGCEAAMAAATMGLITLVITSNADRIGHLSCNPAIGGLGKGHMVREIDALGGSMGRWADEAAIQVRTLNATKGPAVRATRAQVDRGVYMRAVQRDLFGHPNIFIHEEMVDDILTADGRVRGVRTASAIEYRAPHVLITAGTFLRGKLFIGERCAPGGRRGDAASDLLSRSLTGLGLILDRFMTCTTPRLLTASIDFSKMQPQPGDQPRPRFSPRGQENTLPQELCYLTWTNERTHEVIERALKRSPMYNGAIPGPGPRYCPAIEDKIARFPEKERHQIFIEPEGSASPETYPNNIPTGLPLDAQIDLLRTIPGLEGCHVTRPGYAIEYDICRPTQLSPSLETKTVPGLWLAGQVNGTSGYEEAAAQGLWAAMNIAARIQGRSGFLPGRDEAYMAVMVDDLVTKGVTEPYRMFTSRAEHRLLLREGNADARLTPLGREHGLVMDPHWEVFLNRSARQAELLDTMEKRRFAPDAAAREIFTAYGLQPPASAMPLGELFRRPGVTADLLARFWPGILDYPEEVIREVETHCRYSGYVERQEHLARRQKDLQAIPLPADLDYYSIAGLTTESREKLSSIRPASLGQAGRIPGVTPAALVCLEIHLKKLSSKSA